MWWRPRDPIDIAGLPAAASPRALAEVLASTGGSISQYIGRASAVVAAVAAIGAAVIVVPVVTGGDDGGGCPVETAGALDGPDPWGSCWPGPETTGVPDGTTLTAYTGPTTITTDDTVIDGKTIDGCLTIEAEDVVIRNSEIDCDGTDATSTSAVFLGDGNDTGYEAGWSVTIEDTEVDCGGDPPNGFNNSKAFGSAFMTIRRVNIHGCENGLDVNQVMDMRDSYVHDLRQCSSAECGGDGSHTDGVQFADHFSPPGSGTIVNGVVDFTLIHNVIFSMKAGAPTDGSAGGEYFTTSALISGPTGDTNIIIDKNLLAGGAYTLYCEQGGHSYLGTSHVNDNHFSTRFKSTIGAFGGSTECDDEGATGNVIHETGAPYALEG